MKKFGMILLWLIIIVSIVTIFSIMCSDGDKKNEEKTEKVEKGQDKTEAYIMAQQILKKQLKAPSTAKFQKQWDGVKVVYYTNTDTYGITFWVDAQNSFGAMLRTTYNVNMKKTDEKHWKMTDVKKVN